MCDRGARNKRKGINTKRPSAWDTRTDTHAVGGGVCVLRGLDGEMVLCLLPGKAERSQKFPAGKPGYWDGHSFLCQGYNLEGASRHPQWVDPSRDDRCGQTPFKPEPVLKSSTGLAEGRYQAYP